MSADLLGPGDVEGTWYLLSWRQEYDDGRVVLPVGESPRGWITYAPDGLLSVLISAAERPPFTTGGQWDASVEERASAYSTFLAYGGTWALDADRLEHRVEISLYPGWVGVTQVRRPVLVDGVLTLSTRLEEGTTEARYAVLRWSRMRPA